MRLPINTASRALAARRALVLPSLRLSSQSALYRYSTSTTPHATDSEAAVRADTEPHPTVEGTAVHIKAKEKTKETTTVIEEDIVTTQERDNSGDDVTNAQHPGAEPELDLADPTLSEVIAHVEREPDLDPLKGKLHHRAFSTSTRHAFLNGGTTSTSSSAASSEQDHDPQRLESSGHDHLDKPSLSEESVHADRHEHDPLGGSEKKVGGEQSKKRQVQPEDKVFTKEGR